MGLPNSKAARQFWRSSKQRFDDAELLLKAGHTTGAVYLAGYGVECMLKALLVNSTPKNAQESLIATFRGAKAHDFEWLQYQYRTMNCPPIPQDIREHFVLVSTWSTDFRYRPGIIDQEDATDFLASAEAIIKWADGRI